VPAAFSVLLKTRAYRGAGCPHHGFRTLVLASAIPNNVPEILDCYKIFTQSPEANAMAHFQLYRILALVAAVEKPQLVAKNQFSWP
jgi:hypothetical protein